MPTMAAESAPKAWLRAVRCGTAVMCTMPSGTPMSAPMISAMTIHLYCDDLGIEERGDDRQRSPISPARTPGAPSRASSAT